MVNESMISVEDTSKCVTNEEPMTELVTVTSKDDDNIVVDKVTNNNDNVRKILVISKETLGTETMEKVDKVDAEEGKIVVKDDDLKITSDVERKINLMKSIKVKELEKISVDIKKVDNINDQIEA